MPKRFLDNGLRRPEGAGLRQTPAGFLQAVRKPFTETRRVWLRESKAKTRRFYEEVGKGALAVIEAEERPDSAQGREVTRLGVRG